MKIFDCIVRTPILYPMLFRPCAEAEEIHDVNSLSVMACVSCRHKISTQQHWSHKRRVSRCRVSEALTIQGNNVQIENIVFGSHVKGAITRFKGMLFTSGESVY